MHVHLYSYAYAHILTYINKYAQYILILIQFAPTMQKYKKIQSQIKKNESLTQSIQQLYKSLLPKRKFQAHKLSEQQSLALVYEHMRAPLNKIKDQIQKLITDEQGGNTGGEEGEGQGNADGLPVDGQAQQLLQEQQQQQQQQQQYQQQRDQEQYRENQQQFQHDQLDQGRQDDGQMASQDDVGLYGQQIDQQEMQSYQNQQMDDDPQFGNFKLNKIQQRNLHEQKLKKKKNKQMGQQQEDMGQEQGGQEEDYIEDNFDQFRQIERDNDQAKKEVQDQNNQLEKQIQRLQERAMGNKNWVLGGEVKGKQRPVNSLLGTDLQFRSGVKYTHQITQSYNSSLQSIIKQRILDEIFDDRVRNIPLLSNFGRKGLQNVSTQKSSKGLAELYQIQFKNSLGLGDNKNQKLKKQIMDSLKEINYYLDSLSNTGFSVKPKNKIQRNGSQAIILQDKVPVTSWNGTIQANNIKTNFQSDKQINKKTKRLRNKRNARQRKKQQDRKKMNKAIQYGGMTKIQVQARKKIAKSKQNAQAVKYSKSSSFFKNIDNKNKAGKPNPNINKLKI